MSLIALSAGFLIGGAFVRSLKPDDYIFFRYSFYEPHLIYKNIKLQKIQKDLAYTSKDLEIHIKSTILKAINYFSYYLYGKKNEFLFYKQQNNFVLIKKFEFVNETIKDFEKIQSNIQERIVTENKKNEIKIKDEENLMEQIYQNVDDKNLENIVLLKENTNDEYLKYAISSNLFTTSDYDKKITPEIKLLKQTNKLVIAASMKESRRMWDDQRKKDAYEDFTTDKNNPLTLNYLRNNNNNKRPETIEGKPKEFSEFNDILNFDRK